MKKERGVNMFILILSVFFLLSWVINDVVMFAFSGMRMPWLTALINFFLSQAALYVIAAILFLFLAWKTKRWFYPVCFAGAVAIARYGTDVVKLLFNVPRPAARLPITPLDSIDSSSFPSTHASIYFAMATIFAMAYPKQRYWIYGFAGLLSLTRIYLGVHYLSDVIAWAVLGYGIAILALIAGKKLLQNIEKEKFINIKGRKAKLKKR